MKNIRIVLSENSHFLVVNFSIYVGVFLCVFFMSVEWGNVKHLMIHIKIFGIIEIVLFN